MHDTQKEIVIGDMKMVLAYEHDSELDDVMPSGSWVRRKFQIILNICLQSVEEFSGCLKHSVIFACAIKRIPKTFDEEVAYVGCTAEL